MGSFSKKHLCKLKKQSRELLHTLPHARTYARPSCILLVPSYHRGEKHQATASSALHNAAEHSAPSRSGAGWLPARPLFLFRGSQDWGASSRRAEGWGWSFWLPLVLLCWHRCLWTRQQTSEETIYCPCCLLLPWLFFYSQFVYGHWKLLEVLN